MTQSCKFVIPSEARDLHFAAGCRSLASLGMTNHEEYPLLRYSSVPPLVSGSCVAMILAKRKAVPQR